MRRETKARKLLARLRCLPKLLMDYSGRRTAHESLPRLYSGQALGISSGLVPRNIGGLQPRHYLRSPLHKSSSQTLTHERMIMEATFLDLPAELRNAIYDLYLANRTQRQSVLVDEEGKVHYLLPPPLCRTSRQIRTKTLQYSLDPTQSRTLEVIVNDLNLGPLRTWLEGEVLNTARRRFVDVHVVFRFTDTAQIAHHGASAPRKWAEMPLTYVSARCTVSGKRNSGKFKPYWRQWGPPRMSYSAELDLDGVEGQGEDKERRRAQFEPNSDLLAETVRRAKQVQSRRFAGIAAEEDAFRTWLRGKLFCEGGKKRRPRYI